MWAGEAEAGVTQLSSSSLMLPEAWPVPVVPLPHAVVEPHAMVIKSTHTFVAGPTVL